MRLRERLRRELLSETGLDFSRLRPSTRSVTGEGAELGGRLFGDLLMSMSAGLATAIILGLGTALAGMSGPAAFFAALGAATAGLGVAALVAGVRLRRRVPEEVESVFRVAGELAHDASAQLEAVTGSAEQLVRGLVVVSAIPAVTAAVSRRFLVLAPVVRLLLDGLLSRIVDKGMPTVMATMPDASPRIRQIATGVVASRDRVIGRASTLARWGTLPLRVIGVGLSGVGVMMTILAWIFGLD